MVAVDLTTSLCRAPGDDPEDRPAPPGCHHRQPPSRLPAGCNPAAARMPGSRTATAVMNAAANGAKSTPCGCTPRWSMTARCHSPHRRPSAAPAPRVPRNRGRSRGQAYQRAGQLVGLGQGGRGRLVVPAVGVDGAEDDAGEADDADLLTCSPVRSSPGPRSGWWVEGGWRVSRYRSTTRSRPSATTATSRFVTGGLLLLDLSPSPPSLAPRGRHVVEASAHLRPPSTGVLGWLLPGRRAVD